MRAFSLALAPSVIKNPIISDHPSSSCACDHHHRAPSLNQSNHLHHSRWANVASPTMRLLTAMPTTKAPHAFHHQLEHHHCLFIKTVHQVCIKLATSNPTCVGLPLPLQPCAFSHRRLQQWHHTPSTISLSIIIASSSASVPS